MFKINDRVRLTTKCRSTILRSGSFMDGQRDKLEAVYTVVGIETGTDSGDPESLEKPADTTVYLLNGALSNFLFHDADLVKVYGKPSLKDTLQRFRFAKA